MCKCYDPPSHSADGIYFPYLPTHFLGLQVGLSGSRLSPMPLANATGGQPCHPTEDVLAFPLSSASLPMTKVVNRKASCVSLASCFSSAAASALWLGPLGQNKRRKWCQHNLAVFPSSLPISHYNRGGSGMHGEREEERATTEIRPRYDAAIVVQTDGTQGRIPCIF